MQRFNDIPKKRLLGAITILIIALSITSGLYVISVTGTDYTSIDLSVSPSGSSFKLSPNQNQTFTAQALNGTAPFTYTWIVSASGNFNLSINGEIQQLSNASSIKTLGDTLILLYPYAVEKEFVSVSVSVTDANGYSGNLAQPFVVADPYSSPGYKFDGSTATASYIIQADGKGWYRAINGTTGAVSWSSTDALTIIQSAINNASSTGSVLVRRGSYPVIGSNLNVSCNVFYGEGAGTIFDLSTNGLVASDLSHAILRDFSLDLTHASASLVGLSIKDCTDMDVSSISATGVPTGVTAIKTFGSTTYEDSRDNAFTKISVEGASTTVNCVAFHVADSYRTSLRDSKFRNVGTGILFETVNEWAEGSYITNLDIYNPLVGIKSLATGGTGSFSRLTLDSVNIDLRRADAIGFYEADGTQMDRSSIDINVFFNANGTVTGNSGKGTLGAFIGGKMDGTQLFLSFETFVYGTCTTGWWLKAPTDGVTGNIEFESHSPMYYIHEGALLQNLFVNDGDDTVTHVTSYGDVIETNKLITWVRDPDSGEGAYHTVFDSYLPMYWYIMDRQDPQRIVMNLNLEQSPYWFERFYGTTDRWYSDNANLTAYIVGATGEGVFRDLQVSINGGSILMYSANGTPYEISVTNDGRITTNATYTLSDTVLINDPSVVSKDSATYVMVKQINVGYLSGTIRIAFDSRDPSGLSHWVHAQLYVNGVAVGTERSQNGDWYTYTEDITVSANDLIQLYVKNSDSGYPIEVRNFQIRGTSPTLQPPYITYVP